MVYAEIDAKVFDFPILPCLKTFKSLPQWNLLCKPNGCFAIWNCIFNFCISYHFHYGFVFKFHWYFNIECASSLKTEKFTPIEFCFVGISHQKFRIVYVFYGTKYGIDSLLFALKIEAMNGKQGTALFNINSSNLITSQASIINKNAHIISSYFSRRPRSPIQTNKGKPWTQPELNGIMG